MAHFQQTVTWVGLELNAARVTGKGGATRGGGGTRGGGVTRESGVTRGDRLTRGGGVTRIGWTLDAVSTEV